MVADDTVHFPAGASRRDHVARRRLRVRPLGAGGGNLKGPMMSWQGDHTSLEAQRAVVIQLLRPDAWGFHLRRGRSPGWWRRGPVRRREFGPKQLLGAPLLAVGVRF